MTGIAKRRLLPLGLLTTGFWGFGLLIGAAP
ncbi:MAG: hypothetical protein BMS9Abin11_0705 [Gammaproteobacteria bacterium]|nr:MAG: hypothetical protein BMS9Abin11_0705 [Gammaproteobacteria bacterium]